MKKLSALLSLALGLSLIPTVFAADKKPAPTTTKPTTTAAKPTAAPAKPSATAPKTAVKAAATKEAPKAAAAEEPAKELVGILIERKAGGFINLKIDGGNFVMTFLDKDKKETKPDVLRATAKYRKNKSNHRHLLVPAADGKSLRAPTPVDRPYVINTMLVVLFDDNENNAAEAYTVNFKQITPSDTEGIPADEMTPEQLQKVAK